MASPDGGMQVRVAAAAYPIDWLNRWNDYVGKLRIWVRTACEGGAELLVFPEFAAFELATLAEEVNAADPVKSVDAISARLKDVDDLHASLSREFGAVICAGSGPLRTREGAVFNRARLFSPEGGRGAQDKLIPDAEETAVWGVAPGGGARVFETATGADRRADRRRHRHARDRGGDGARRGGDAAGAWPRGRRDRGRGAARRGGAARARKPVAWWCRRRCLGTRPGRRTSVLQPAPRACLRLRAPARRRTACWRKARPMRRAGFRPTLTTRRWRWPEQRPGLRRTALGPWRSSRCEQGQSRPMRAPGGRAALAA